MKIGKILDKDLSDDVQVGSAKDGHISVKITEGFTIFLMPVQKLRARGRHQLFKVSIEEMGLGSFDTRPLEGLLPVDPIGVPLKNQGYYCPE